MIWRRRLEGLDGGNMVEVAGNYNATGLPITAGTGAVNVNVHDNWGL